jgi:hypothetical protein
VLSCFAVITVLELTLVTSMGGNALALTVMPARLFAFSGLAESAVAKESSVPEPTLIVTSDCLLMTLPSR